MYTYVHIYTSIYKYIYTHTRTHTYIHIHINTRNHIHGDHCLNLCFPKQNLPLLYCHISLQREYSDIDSGSISQHQHHIIFVYKSRCMCPHNSVRKFPKKNHCHGRPLWWAYEFKREGMKNLLVKRGIDVQAKGKNSQKPALHSHFTPKIDS